MAIELTQEIGRRITTVTEDSRETTFLFQRLSIALQRGNAVSFQNTMITEWGAVATCNHITLLTSIFPPAGFVLVGPKNIKKNNNNSWVWPSPLRFVYLRRCMILSFFIVFYPVFRTAVVVASLLVVLCSRWFFSFVLVLSLYPRLDNFILRRWPSSLVTWSVCGSPVVFRSAA